MEREQIIKALECCVKIGCGGLLSVECDECPYSVGSEDCKNLEQYALSLIKELTEKNESLSTALAKYDQITEVRIAEEYVPVDAYDELREENERLHASYTEFERKCASLNDENEGLRAELDSRPPKLVITKVDKPRFDRTEYQKKYYAERRERRKAEGLCVLCGAGLSDEDRTRHTLCEECRAKQRTSSKKFRETHHKEKPGAYTNGDYQYDPDEANICLSCTKKACVGTCEHYTKQKKKLLEERKNAKLKRNSRKDAKRGLQGSLSGGVSSNEDTL